tara:strand:+ start:70 stop:1044 length:975 start_codon:yes stop_codon:yes gene_type:complete
MKDLILIPTYAPDNQRKEILRNFVKSINKDIFDIMVVSHSSIPTDIIENTDYFIYDSKNILLTDTKYKYTMYYTQGTIKVVSTENRPFNHFLAALKLVTLGLSTARNEGYTKVHCIEYDTELNSDQEFLDNSILLEEYSLVYYNTDYTPNLISFPVSFNLNKIDEKWFEFDIDVLKNWTENNTFKTIENYENIIIANENAYSKFYTSLLENGVKINTFYSGGEDIWVTPVVDINNDLILFSWNKRNTLNLTDIEVYNIQVIINNENYFNLDLNLGVWRVDTLGGFDSINTLTIIRNNKKIINYDFTQISKEEYKTSNYIINNNV